MSGEQIDPSAVHALSGEILAFLSQRSGVSQEMQSAALRVAAVTIEESVNAFNAAVNRDNMRNFFKKR